MAAVSIGAASPGQRRKARLLTWAIAVVTTAAVGTIGWVDLTRHTGGYADDLSADLTRLRHALAASVVVSVIGLLVWVFVPALRRVARRIQRPSAWIAAALVVLAILGLWLIRPLVEVARPSLTVSPTMSTTNAIQRRQGLKVEPRSYAEHSLWWMAWYLGIPALVAAIAGFGTAAWQTVRGRATAATTAVGVLTLGGGAVYWWDPSITPVQLWASRRFMPAVFPGLTVMAVVALAMVVMLPIVRRQAPALRWVGAGALLAVLVLPAAMTTWPLRWQRSQGGFLQPVLDTCDGMRGNPAVVMAGNYESLALQQTLRSWCGVPVAAQGSALDGGPSAQELASTLKARGYDMYLVGADESTMDRWATAVGSVRSASAGVWDRHTVQETVDRAPEDYAPARRVLPLDGPFQLFWVPVEPTTR
jgi:hypothetical protein